MQAGYVKGHISYADGRPLPNATVDVKDQDYGTGPSVRTDGSGDYSAQVPAGNFRVDAFVQVQYHNHTFHLGLEPVGSNDNFRGEKGYVKNFILKISGAIPGSSNPDEPNLGFWGMPAAVSWADAMQASGPRKQIPEGAKILLTFTPSGTLMDGSSGKAQLYTIDPHPSGSGRYIYYSPDKLKDVPAGAYHVSAKLTTGDDLQVSAGYGVLNRPMHSEADFVPEPSVTAIRPYTGGCCEPFEVYVYPK